jgi:hypothetical protein
MRWNRKEAENPKGGEIKTVRRFAWRPIQAGDKVVWLENYCARFKFFQPTSGNPGWWVDMGNRAQGEE